MRGGGVCCWVLADISPCLPFTTPSRVSRWYWPLYGGTITRIQKLWRRTLAKPGYLRNAGKTVLVQLRKIFYWWFTAASADRGDMAATGGGRSDMMNLRQNVVIPCVQCNQGGYRHGYSGTDIFTSFTNIFTIEWQSGSPKHLRLLLLLGLTHCKLWLFYVRFLHFRSFRKTKVDPIFMCSSVFLPYFFLRSM